MSKEKAITIAFPAGGIIPADQSKTGKEERVPAHEPVSVNETYGRHLLHEKIAYKSDGKERAKPTAKADDSAGRAQELVAAAEAKAKEVLDAAEAKAKEAIETAEGQAQELVAAAEAKAKEVLDAAEARAKEIVDAAGTGRK